MRDVPASIATQLTEHRTTLARCVTMQLRDGTVIGMSDHDELLVATIPGAGVVQHQAGAGILVGDIQLSVSLDAGNTEITCPISTLIGRPQVMGRRFNQSTVWVYDLDWNEEDPAPLPLMKGLIADSRIEEAVAVFELRDNNDFWNVTIGGILTPRCRADFGDVKCGMEREEVPGLVTSVDSSMVFRTSLAGSWPTDHFRFGDCVFTSGTLDGVWPIEVVAFDGTTGEVELLVPLPNAPEVGDALVLHNGCSRLKTSTDPTIPTCFTHANVPRFRGFDQVPGSDTYIKFAAPGGG